VFKIADSRDVSEMNSNKINKSLFRQFNIGIWWGAFRNLLQQANFYLLLLTCVSSVTTLFVTVVNPWLADNFGIRIPFYIMVIVAIVILLIILLFEHKLTMPSYFSYWTQQWWKHDNPLPGILSKSDKEYKQRFDKLEKQNYEIIKLLKKKGRKKH